jgi:hypothetical protein
MRETSYRTGDIIIAEGDYTSDAYIIRRGFVEVYHAGPPEQRLSILATRPPAGCRSTTAPSSGWARAAS